jgi:hypothetical protein
VLAILAVMSVVGRRDIVALKKRYLSIHDIYIPVSCMVAP